jgi:Tol biopolymer transport system component
MTIDERVRDALHAYADPIEPAPGSWDRIEARLDDRLPRERRPRTPLVLAGVGILVIVALIAAAVVRDVGDESNVVSDPGVVAPMPSRILAITVDRKPVVIDSKTSQRVNGFGTFGGIPPGSQVAVTPDGSRAFVVQGGEPGGLAVRSALGCAESQVVQLDLQQPRVDGVVSERAGAPTVSPDGRYLAYLRCRPNNPRPAEIVLVDLETGAETVAPAGPVDLLGRLSFAPDSRHVVFDVWEGDLTAVRRFDLVGREPVPVDAQNGDDFSTAFRGSSDAQLVPNGDRFVYESRDSRPLGGGRLFRLPGPLDQVTLASDRSGDHILATNDGSLYRWSVGDEEPTKLTGEYFGAAWIPGTDPPVPEPSPTALPPQRVLVFGTTSTGGTSMVVLSSASREGIGEMQGVSGVVAGSPVAVTPDGAFAYVVRKSPNSFSTCGGGDSIFKQAIGPGVRAGDEIPNATAPAVSPDGKYLAYLACRADGDGPWLTMRDLQTGEEESNFFAVDYDAARLQFSPDSSRLLVASTRQPSSAEFEVVNGRLRRVGFGAAATSFAAGYWGADTFVVLDRTNPSGAVLAVPRAGGTAETLLDAQPLDGTVTNVIPNLAGNALLVIVDDSRLYWWAPGMAAPSPLDQKMLTAAWMPDAPAQPASAPSTGAHVPDDFPAAVPRPKALQLRAVASAKTPPMREHTLRYAMEGVDVDATYYAYLRALDRAHFDVRASSSGVDDETREGRIRAVGKRWDVEVTIGPDPRTGRLQWELRVSSHGFTDSLRVG